jgi:hypothetical protein
VFCDFPVQSLRFAALLALLPLAALAAPWDPVSPADLQATSRSTLDPEAPAEAIFRRVDVDDSGFPGDRTVTAYSRYRIFDPEKATGLTRIAEQSISVFGEQNRGAVEMRARLTLPDGSVHEFGNEAIRERNLVQAAAERSWMARIFSANTNVEVAEKFLAVTGIVPGAILDIQTSHREGGLAGGDWLYVANLQQYDAPVRQLAFAYHAAENDEWQGHPITLNGAPNHADVQVDTKHRTLHLVAHDVPALYHEPLSVPLTSYALIYVITYHPAHLRRLAHHGASANYVVNTKTDPWGFYATEIAMAESDFIDQKGAIKQLATTITTSAPNDVTKAKLIHQYVVGLHHRYAARPHPGVFTSEAFNQIESVMQLVNFEKYPDLPFQPMHFVILEVALDRALGFPANTVMLPNLNFARFDERMVANQFLSVYAARVRIGDQWNFSLPTTAAPLAFNELPWQNEGEEGLIAQPVKQEFFPVPATTAAESKIMTSGQFELSAEGTLTGEGTRTLTGHLAATRRAQIQRMNPERTKRYFAERFAADLKGGTVRVLEVKNAHDPDLPLEVSFRVNWPAFALVTKDRLIFHPSIFHFNQTSPFTAASRRYAFQFPYRWSETEHLTIAVPPEFALESKQAPGPIPGDQLSYQCEISQERVSKKIRYARDFTTNLRTLTPEANGALLAWYRNLTDHDAFELVLRRTAAPATPADSEAP